jgi:regulator of replication initiation timing
MDEKLCPKCKSALFVEVYPDNAYIVCSNNDLCKTKPVRVSSNIYDHFLNEHLEHKKVDSSVERLNSQRIDLINTIVNLEKELQNLKTQTIDLKKIYHERFDENTKLIDENRKLSGVFHENTVLLNKCNKYYNKFIELERQHKTLKEGYEILKADYNKLDVVYKELKWMNSRLREHNGELNDKNMLLSSENSHLEKERDRVAEENATLTNKLTGLKARLANTMEALR